MFFSGEKMADSKLDVIWIYFDTASFDEIERDQKIKFEAQLSLIGGTMGLLTGFSIISGLLSSFFSPELYPLGHGVQKTRKLIELDKARHLV